MFIPKVASVLAHPLHGTVQHSARKYFENIFLKTRDTQYIVVSTIQGVPEKCD